jgi:hypothetical protein
MMNDMRIINSNQARIVLIMGKVSDKSIVKSCVQIENAKGMIETRKYPIGRFHLMALIRGL